MFSYFRFCFTFFGNFIWHFWNFFSILQLSLTLFSPWKKQVESKKSPGFNLSEFFNEIAYNSISRVLGAFTRFITILMGLFFIIITIFAGSLLTFSFVLFPFYWSIRLIYHPYMNELNDVLHDKQSVLSTWRKLFLGKFGMYLCRKLEITQEKYQILESLITRFDKEKKSYSSLRDFFAQILSNNKILDFFQNIYISEREVFIVIDWFQKQEEDREFKKRFWEKNNLMKMKAIGKDWAFGYTLNLNKFSTEIGDSARFRKDIMGRNDEIQNLENILSKNKKKNVLLVGPTGCGKKTIVEALAKKISLGYSVPALAYKRILFLDVNALISQKDTPEERRQLLHEALSEASDAGNIILVINNFDRFISDGPGRINLSPTFAETIEKGKVILIGIVSLDFYHKFVMSNETILSAFEIKEVFEIKKEKAVEILNNIYVDTKNHAFSLFSFEEIVERSNLLITDIPFPEKAINLADEIMSNSRNDKNFHLITKKVTDDFLTKKLKVPIGNLSQIEKNTLLNLEQIIRKRLVNQENAVLKIVSAMQRGRLEIGKRKKPFGSFLFLGPTGVGKTETAKALAEGYFGNEKNIIRFDMSEYQDVSKIEDFVGSPKTEQFGVLIEKVKENPFSILLLDEIEKANKNILNIFLTILDEGYLTDYKGNQVSFEHQIIIATSNAGSVLINKLIKEGIDSSEIEKQVFESVITDGTFAPEFLNRFDSVVYYKPLSKDNLGKIALMNLKALNDEIYANHRIRFKITEEMIGKIVDEGYSPEFGARPMKRVISEKISSKIAKIILEGKVKIGEELEINI